MRSTYSVFGVLSGCLFSFLIFVSYTSKAPTVKLKSDLAVDLPQLVNSAYVDKTYYWAGEEMPNTFDAKERLDRELSINAYRHSNTLLNLKKANKYFPVMRPILVEEGIPEDFLYLSVAESDLRNAVSPASAKGFWQFRSLAAKEMNLEVNKEVDERYNLEKSTRAACKYLKKLRKKYGSWTNAAAAYNVGQGNFTKLQRTQGEESFYDMNLNQETSRYVFRLIALKEIMSQPEAFGFALQQEDLYPPLDNYIEVKVDKSIPNWKDFASEHGVSYRMLKVYNPWLIDTKLTVKKNTYTVKIPK